MNSIDTLVDRAHQSAARLGIKKYDIYGALVEDTSVQVDRGNPKQVKASQRSGVTVRVWNQANRVGITSTTAIDDLGLELALQMAQEASAFGPEEYGPDFSPAAQEPVTPVERPLAAPVPVTQLLRELVAAEQSLLAAHPAIQGVPYNGIAQQKVDKFYLNSQGARRQESRTSASIYLYTKTEIPGKKPRSAGAMRLGLGLEDLDIQGCLQEAAEKTISHLDYAPVTSGQYRVVFSPEAFLSLWAAFGNLYNAQSILDRQSLSTPESLGTTVASPLLSVWDNALHPSNIGAPSFDGEGTPTQPVQILEQGVLKSFLHSAGTAKRLGASPTGHAVIGAKVSVSPHFFHVLPGQPPDQTHHLETDEQVVFVDDLQALHAGVQALQGSFSLPFDGWLVRRGERVSIEAATIAGDIRKLLNSIIYVEPNPELTRRGFCPRVWVEGVAVTGEAGA